MTGQSAVPAVIPCVGNQAPSGTSTPASKPAGKSNFSSYLQKVQTGTSQDTAEAESSGLLCTEGETQDYLILIPFPLASGWTQGEILNGKETENPKFAAGLPLQAAVAAQSSTQEATAVEMVPAVPSSALQSSAKAEVTAESGQGSPLPEVPVVQDEAPTKLVSAENKTGSTEIPKQFDSVTVNAAENPGAEKPGNNKISVEKNQDLVLDVKKALEFESGKINSSKMSSGSQNDAQEKTSSSTQNPTHTGLILEPKISRSDGTPLEIIKPPLNAREILDQMAEKIELLQNKDTQEIKVDLKPDSLGKMSIKIAMEGGVLTAKIITDNFQVKNLLESNIHLLKQTLDNQGIKVDRTDVNVQLNNEGMFNQSGSNPQESWQERRAFISVPGAPEFVEEDSSFKENELYASSYAEAENAGLYGEYGTMNFLA